MRQSVLRYTFLILLTLLLAACSGKFDTGEKVWIDLPGKSLARDGYAVGQVIEYKDDLVHVQVIELRADNGHELLPVMRIGQVYVPARSLSPYAEGKRRFEEKQRAVRLLDKLDSADADEARKALSEVSRIADKYDLDELRRYVALYQLRNRYLAKPMPLEKRLAGVPDFIEELEKLLRANRRAYDYLVDWSMMRYRSMFVDVARRLGFALNLANRRPGAPDLFEQALVRVVRDIQDMIDRAGNDKDPMRAARRVKRIDKAERALMTLLSRNGKAMGGEETLDALLEQKGIDRRQRLAMRVKQMILSRIDFQRIKTRDQAQQAWRDARAQGRKAGKLLGVPVFTKDDEKRYFTGPLEERERRAKERARREEERAWRRVMGRHGVARYNALRQYLKRYPNGRHAARARKMLKVMTQARKKRTRLRKQREQTMLRILTSGKTYQGKAEYKGQMLDFRIRFSRYSRKTGNVAGVMTWPSRKGASNRIEGRFDRDKRQLVFRETKEIASGDWHTGDEYRFTLSGNRLVGTHRYKRFLLINKTGKAWIAVH